MSGEQIFIIHVELQAQTQTIFPMRMFLYNVRSFDWIMGLSDELEEQFESCLRIASEV